MPVQSTEECKALKYYSKNYAVQRPHKDEARSCGNKKSGKTIQFDGTIKDVNSMTASDAPIPRKTKGKSQAKKPKSDKETATPEEKERTYGIDRLNIGDPAVESENESERVLMQHKEGHMANKKYGNNNIKRDCNVLSNFLNAKKMG